MSRYSFGGRGTELMICSGPPSGSVKATWERSPYFFGTRLLNAHLSVSICRRFQFTQPLSTRPSTTTGASEIWSASPSKSASVRVSIARVYWSQKDVDVRTFFRMSALDTPFFSATTRSVKPDSMSLQIDSSSSGVQLITDVILRLLVFPGPARDDADEQGTDCARYEC